MFGGAWKRGLGAAALAALLVAPACSSSAGSDSSATTKPGAPSSTIDAGLSTTTLPSTVPKAFTGSVDDFYVVPKPLPKGRPGEIIRIQPQGSDAGSVTLRVMYHS